jgi:hypothetical protein
VTPSVPAGTTPGPLAATASSPTGVLSTAPLVTISSSKIAVARGAATLRLDCRVAACAGTAALTLPVSPKHHSRKGVGSNGGRLVIAEGTFSLAPGSDGRIALRLTSAGKLRLRQTGRHPFTAELTLSLLNGKPVSKRVVLG